MKINDTRFHTQGERWSKGAFLLGAVLLSLVVLGTPTQTFGQAKVGTTGAQFLELGVSARAMGMAEAFVAVSDDISSIYYNPAGLTYLYGRELAFTNVQMPAGVNYNFSGFGFPLESIGGVLGIGIYGLFSGKIDETSYDRVPTGRTFVWNDYAIAVSYGRYLTDRFSIGVTVKYITERAHDYSANGWAADVGTLYNTGFRGFKIGMAITNFGPDMTFIRNAYPLPINFKFGGAINVIDGVDHILTFAAEGWHPSDNLEKYNTGLEYVYHDRYILRSGWRFNYNADGLTAGAGVRVPFGEDREIRVDYAYQDFGVLDQIHRFTLGILF